MRISDWSSDVCSSDLGRADARPDVLGPLGDAVHRASRRLQHLAGAGVDLAGHEARDQDLAAVAYVVPPRGQVVLVAAVAVARRVGVVLEAVRSDKHTSELPSLMRNSYASLCLRKKKHTTQT